MRTTILILRMPVSNTTLLVFAALLYSPAVSAAQQPLRRIVITAQTQMCPILPSAGARDIWAVARMRYTRTISLLPDAATLVRRGGWAKGITDFENLGCFAQADSAVAATDGVRNAEASVFIGNGRPLSARLRFAKDGYATRIANDEPRLLYQPDYFHWYYARLDGLLVDHWLDDAFAANNDLAIEAHSGGYVITFCGRDHGRPWIEGVIDITEDSLLTHIAFRYFTPEPRENAAAEMWFGTDSGNVGATRRLLPVRSIFYRRGSPESVWFQEAWINLTWCAWESYEASRARATPLLESTAQGCSASPLSKDGLGRVRAPAG